MTHHDKKLQGGPNPLAASGEQLDQSQDSAERKESVYNLRNMFKDVRPPSESSSGSAQSGGKRRRSIGRFGLRRGSDPTAGTGGGVVQFAVQQPPPVLEEPSQAENTGGSPERGYQRVATAEVSQKPQRLAKTLVPVGEQPSSQGKTETVEACVTEEDSADAAKPETSQNSAIKVSYGGTAASAPSSLPLQAAHAVKNPVNAEDIVVEQRDLFDPGPLQTSTPIAPMHGSSMGIAPFVNANQPEHYVSNDYPVTQTPPAEAQVGSSPGLISLGSSPLSLSKVRIASSVSSLKTPTSPLSDASTPNSLGYTPSESMRLDLSRTPKTEKKRPGILKSAKPLPLESTSKVLSASSPTGPPHDQRIQSPTSPKSPTGTTRGHVTIVKASPDSRREFSVVTMVEEKESSASPEDNQSESHGFGDRSQNPNINPSVSDVGDLRLPDGASLIQDKDDMVQMEDIQDCKVTQAEDAKALDKV